MTANKDRPDAPSAQLPAETRGAMKIAGIYMLAGLLWILFSDQFVYFFFRDFGELHPHIQTGKGWLFILVTTTLLFLLIRNTLAERLSREQLLQETQNHIQQNNQRLENIINATKIGTWEWSVQTGELQVNLRWAEIAGYGLSELRPLTIETWNTLAHPEDLQKSNQLLQRHFARELEDYECEIRIKHKQGHWVWVLDRGRVIKWNEKDQPVLMTGTHHDITEHKEAEHELRLVQHCLENSAIAIFMIDESGTISRINKEACKSLGYSREELLSLRIFDIDPNFTEKTWYAHRKNIRRKQSGTITSQHRRKDGSIFPVEVTVNYIEFEGELISFSFVKDISERKRLENELNQKNKMEAIGMMAGGMAHNFNNSLAIVIGNLEMALRKMNQPEKLANYLENSRTAALRSRDLVSQILTYSRKDLQEMTTFDLAMLVSETYKLLKSTNPTSIALNLVVDHPGELFIKGDPSRIQEALINLYGNAMHAVDERGKITITLTRARLPEEPPFRTRELEQPSEQYARLRVEDNGCGMTEEVQSKIFDPFFTTKQVNEGTGMGLSTVKGIVDSHGGHIQVTSQPGEGAVFDLYFPLIQEYQKDIGQHESVVVRGQGHILFVDDDQLLIDVGEQMLCELGYQVTTACSAAEALQNLRRYPDRFDLVITDQTMPETTGLQLAAEIKKDHPQLPIIICTGYSSKVAKANMPRGDISAICFKPLKLAEMSKIIQDVLSQGPVKP